jgi:hypothetical protein
MKVRRTAAPAFAAAAVVLQMAGDVRADLTESRERLARTWRALGAIVVVDKTRFLGEDETIAVVLPRLAPALCTTTVFLGARGLGFHVRVLGASDDEADRKVPSEAGAVSIERCGEKTLDRVLLSSDSGRGAVEIVMARSPGPLPPLHVVLPERTGGAIVPGPEPGPLPLLPSPEHRAEIAEGRARLDGGVIEPRVTWRAAVDGSGMAQETLEPGCHRLRLLGLDSRPTRAPGRSRIDLDAEMRDRDDDHLLARDRSDAPDAEVGACVGEETRVEVVFAGSSSFAPVLVVHSSWPLPQFLPTLWGAEARGRMALVLLARHVRSLPRAPVFLAQGGSGTTRVPLSVEPGGCYVALVSVVRGLARAVALRVHVGGEDTVDDRGIDDSGALVAFCALERDRAIARVEVHGAPPVGWGLAVYRIEDGVWETSR